MTCSFAPPCSGPASVPIAAAITYDGDANFHGTDSFAYKVNVNQLDSNVATVTITVAAVNDAPVARDDEFSGEEDAYLLGTVPGVLANDTDAEDDALTAELVTPPDRGTLTLYGDTGPDAD